MAAHAVTGLTQAIHMSYGNGEKFWQQLEAALDLDCWTADIPVNVWLNLHKVCDAYKETRAAWYQEIARGILIKALPLMVIKWQMLGEPKSREQWRKESRDAYNRASDIYLEWESTAKEAITTLTERIPFPVTGVISQHSVEPWVFNEENVDLDWEDHLASCPNEDHDDCYESNEPTLLLGSWKLDPETKQYVADWGNYGDEYAAIYSGSTGCLQVVWSRHTRSCAKCSPCYPGQGDLDTPGDDFLTYDIPPELRVKEETNDEDSN